MNTKDQFFNTRCTYLDKIFDLIRNAESDGWKKVVTEDKVYLISPDMPNDCYEDEDYSNYVINLDYYL